jgi:ABC-type cobalamin transport system permease subunit
MKASGLAAAGATLALEFEQSIVHGAIELVAAGISTRVVCAGLHFAGQLLEPARSEAAVAGVLVTPVWSLDEQPTGLTVSKVADA